ncbi:ABC-2 type transport system ATP-binding protein OS=Streptomyces violarus OX=67380 GN=FHS41_004118 PE=4 SV=1 [Streptomyces violarus]
MENNGHEHVIEVTDLRRVYGGGFEAVSGISFSVRRGEIFALLGTNGAGKTSTVEVLEGLAAPADGRVRVLGHDPYTDRALVPAPHRRDAPGRRLPVRADRRGDRADVGGVCERGRPPAEVLALVGLESKAGTRVKQLSGGQRRRLDLALALLGDPEVLFLDEPTTGLDAEGRRDTWELVSALRDGGTTVLLTTHYLEEAENLADRLAIMHEGRIANTGTPAEVTAAEPSRISFELPEGYFAGDLPPLGELGVTGHETDGRIIRLRTHELQRTATGLLMWAAQAQVELRRLDVRSASLEEAFLGIAREASGERATTTKEYAA